MFLAGLLRRIPPGRWLLQRRYRHQFLHTNRIVHHGVYASFAEATAAIPRGSLLGWDNADSIAHPGMSAERINPRDYPVLFWMRSLWDGEVTVFDFGGHVGEKRYAFARYLDFDSTKKWIVCEVAEIAAAGSRIAAESNVAGLSFTTDFARAAESTLLLCLGVLQFVEEPLGERLRTLARLPQHIIVNGLPLHPERDFVTLEHVGRRFSPYRIFRRDEFIESIRSLGYRLVDQWENPEKSSRIPLHEDHGVARYSGLYFRREA